MKRRDFLKAAVGAITVAVVPLPLEAELPAPSLPIKSCNLSELYLSKEALKDIRRWGVKQVDEETRREIYSGSDGNIKRMVRVSCCSTN